MRVLVLVNTDGTESRAEFDSSCTLTITRPPVFGSTSRSDVKPRPGSAETFALARLETVRIEAKA